MSTLVEKFARAFAAVGLHYAKHRSAAGQGGLFDAPADPEFERLHPRNHGKFTSKGHEAGPDRPADLPGQKDLFGGPSAPAPKPAPKPEPRPEAPKLRQESMFHGLKDMAGQRDLFDLDYKGNDPEKVAQPNSAGATVAPAETAKDPRKQALQAAGELLKAHGKKLPPRAEMERHLGPTVTQEEAEQVLLHAGLDELTAANQAWEMNAKAKERGKPGIDTPTLVIVARSELSRADREGRLKEAVAQAGDATVLRLGKPGSDVTFTVHPATQSDAQGKWQITRWDQHGPSGHQYHDTRELAIASAIGAHPEPYWDEGDHEYRVIEKAGAAAAKPTTAVSPQPGSKPTAKLKSSGGSKWPAEVSFDDLVSHARHKLGDRFAGVNLATYGGGSQFEVRYKGATGMNRGIAATYPVTNEEAAAWRAYFKAANPPKQKAEPSQEELQQILRGPTAKPAAPAVPPAPPPKPRPAREAGDPQQALFETRAQPTLFRRSGLVEKFRAEYERRALVERFRRVDAQRSLVQRFARVFAQRGWTDRYARLKSASGQKSLFDEHEHPRNADGEFKAKGQGDEGLKNSENPSISSVAVSPESDTIKGGSEGVASSSTATGSHRDLGTGDPQMDKTVDTPKRPAAPEFQRGDFHAIGRFAKGMLVQDYQGRLWKIADNGKRFHDTGSELRYELDSAKPPKGWKQSQEIRQAIGEIASHGTHEPGSRGGEEGEQKPMPEGSVVAKWTDQRHNSRAQMPTISVYDNGVVRVGIPQMDDSPILAWVQDAKLAKRLEKAIADQPAPVVLPSVHAQERVVSLKIEESDPRFSAYMQAAKAEHSPARDVYGVKFDSTIKLPVTEYRRIKADLDASGHP